MPRRPAGSVAFAAALTYHPERRMSTPPPEPRRVLDPAAFARLERIGGAGLVRRMCETFLGFAPGRRAALEAARGAADWAAAADAAHALKSSAGNVGAERLRELAQRAELAAGASDQVALAALSPELAAALGEVEGRLRALARGDHTAGDNA